jgi:hypothetical protein
VTVDGGNLYWTNVGDGTIGAVTLGPGCTGPAGRPQIVVTGASQPEGVAVGGSVLYWSNAGTGTIGSFDGKTVNQTFITGASEPIGLTVGGGYLFWANAGTGSIGALNLAGGNSNPTYVQDANHPYGLAFGP